MNSTVEKMVLKALETGNGVREVPAVSVRGTSPEARYYRNEAGCLAPIERVSTLAAAFAGALGLEFVGSRGN